MFAQPKKRAVAGTQLKGGLAVRRVVRGAERAKRNLGGQRKIKGDADRGTDHDDKHGAYTEPLVRLGQCPGTILPVRTCAAMSAPMLQPARRGPQATRFWPQINAGGCVLHALMAMSKKFKSKVMRETLAQAPSLPAWVAAVGADPSGGLLALGTEP